MKHIRPTADPLAGAITSAAQGTVRLLRNGTAQYRPLDVQAGTATQAIYVTVGWLGPLS